MATLILEDGTRYEGTLFGHKAPVTGEVVFTTGMTGYQETLTDPSYCGQIVCMTYPLIGNVGVNDIDNESAGVKMRGFIVSELCDVPSNWQMKKTLDQYLDEQGVTGLYGVDTRALTRHVREYGTLRGRIVEGEPTVLFGSNALKYVQWRDTSVLTSSLDRQARQSQFVEAFCKQALSSAQGNVGTLVNLYTTASNYAVTNLGLNEFSYLASSVLATGITSVDMTTLQGTMQQGDKFAEFYLDKTNVYETVLNVYYHEAGSEE